MEVVFKTLERVGLSCVPKPTLRIVFDYLLGTRPLTMVQESSSIGSWNNKPFCNLFLNSSWSNSISKEIRSTASILNARLPLSSAEQVNILFWFFSLWKSPLSHHLEFILWLMGRNKWWQVAHNWRVWGVKSPVFMKLVLGCNNYGCWVCGIQTTESVE